MDSITRPVLASTRTPQNGLKTMLHLQLAISEVLVIPYQIIAGLLFSLIFYVQFIISYFMHSVFQLNCRTDLLSSTLIISA